MKIYMGSDHAISADKKLLIEHIKSFHSGFEVEDLGTHSSDSCHYPDFAKKVCIKVLQDKALGILICGTGIGMSMVANRYRGIRAGLVKSIEEATLTKLHNNANVLCLGARSSSLDEMKAMISAWLNTKFEGGRHAERVAMFENLGEHL
jgi:ribose 5-phosphate isomerase B